MPKFLIREADIVALTEQMIAGYTAHSSVFPLVVVADFQAGLSNFKAVKQAYEDLKGQTQIATVAKHEDLDSLVEQMLFYVLIRCAKYTNSRRLAETIAVYVFICIYYITFRKR